MRMRGGYRGSATLNFSVERVKDPITGELRPIKDDDDMDELEVQKIELVVEAESSYSPGVTWKRPEDCYPDEGETNINRITGPDKKEWDESDLTKIEREFLIEMIIDEAKSNDLYGESDYVNDD